MESFLKMVFKFVVLVVAIAVALVGNVQGLPPCCPNPSHDPNLECQPIVCDKLPCCEPRTSPPFSNTKHWDFRNILSYYETDQFTIEKNSHRLY